MTSPDAKLEKGIEDAARIILERNIPCSDGGSGYVR